LIKLIFRTSTTKGSGCLSSINLVVANNFGIYVSILCVEFVEKMTWTCKPLVHATSNALSEVILIQSKSERCSGYSLQLTQGTGLRLAWFPSPF